MTTQPELIRPPSLGERCAEAIRANLAATGRKWRELTGADVAAIIDAMPQAEKPAKAAKSRAIWARLPADDEEWLKSLENEPALEGLDVRRELGKCQFYFRSLGRPVSRKRFEAWLLKAEKSVTVSGQGQSSFARQPADPTAQEPQGWREWINANRPDSVYAEGNESCRLAWYQIDATARNYILQQIRAG